MSSEPTRSMTVLVVPAKTPTEIDSLGWQLRREQGGGHTLVDLLHPGEPDVLLGRAIEVPNIYRSAREWDEDGRAVVVTSIVAANDLAPTAMALAAHVADPRNLAERLVHAAGSPEDPERVARALVEELAGAAQGPAEEAADFVWLFRHHVPGAQRLGMGIAWEYRVSATCACAVWDGTTLGNYCERALPPSQFVTLATQDSGGGTERCHAGRLRCLRCRSTFAFVATPSSVQMTREERRANIELSPEEIDRVIAGIRDGHRVDIGGTRCHVTYFGRNGELLFEDFDEGHTTERPCTEAELRSRIAAEPTEFLEVLRSPLRAVLQRALVGATELSPHEALRDLLVYGECLSYRHLLAAVIDWPDGATRETGPALSKEAASELSIMFDGNSVFHFIRACIGYSASTPAAGRYGLRVFATIGAMLGRELPGWRRWRADFRAMTGDVAGAVEDLEWELEQLPPDDSDRVYVQRSIAKLADAQILAQIVANPDDDAPRLVWADMLSERGDPRGELIVAQIRSDNLDKNDPERDALVTRAMHLVALHGRAWGKKGYAWDRGFVDSIEVRYVTAAAHFDEAFALSPPVQGLRFRTYRGDYMEDPARVLADPRLEQLTAMDFTMPVFKIDGPNGETLYPFGSQIAQWLAGRFLGLRALTIRGTELWPLEIAGLGPRSSLRKLVVGDVTLRGLTEALLGERGEHFPQLTELLRLDQCQLDDHDLAPIAKLGALDELDLDDNAIGASGVQSLAGLTVRYLRLAGNPLGDEGAAALGVIANLSAVDLSRTHVGNAGVAKLAALPLASLVLEHTAIDDAAIDMIADGRAGKTLRRLSLGPCGDHRLAGKAIRGLGGMPQLWQLLVESCELDGDDALALFDTLPALRAVAFKDCLIDDAGLAKLVAHPVFARLDVLEVSRNKLGPDAGAILARAPRLPQQLFLNHNRIGDVGARAIAEAPAAGRVTHLILQANEITEAGARALVGDTSQLVGTVGKLCLHENAIGTAAAEIGTEKLGTRFCIAAPT